MVLDAALFTTQHYKVCIKGSGAIQGKEYCSPLYHGVVANEEGAFRSPSTMVANFTDISVKRIWQFNNLK